MLETKKTAETPHHCTMGRLLLVVDGSNASLAASDFALALAAEKGCSIVAVYVVDTSTMDYLVNMRLLLSTERIAFEKQLEATGHRHLERVVNLAETASVKISTHMSKGIFHKSILHLAREHQADAIVVGGWQRTVTRKDYPSVERQAILDEAECPVIVVKEGWKFPSRR